MKSKRRPAMTPKIQFANTAHFPVPVKLAHAQAQVAAHPDSFTPADVPGVFELVAQVEKAVATHSNRQSGLVKKFQTFMAAHGVRRSAKVLKTLNSAQLLKLFSGSTNRESRIPNPKER